MEREIEQLQVALEAEAQKPSGRGISRVLQEMFERGMLQYLHEYGTPILDCPW